MLKLKGKVVLITGGTTGIGAATAKLFRDEGATVIVTGSSHQTVEAARRDLSGIEMIVADQCNIPEIKILIEKVKSKHRRIDILFANAGVGFPCPIELADEVSFDKQFGINVKGAYFTVKHALEIMPAGGAIIFTASHVASMGAAGMSIYSATKAALRSFGRTLATELAPRGIRVNTISPGPVDTPIFSKTGMSKEEIGEFIDRSVAKVPLKRIGRPEEIAAAVLFLAVDATFTTAGELIADGGALDT